MENKKCKCTQYCQKYTQNMNHVVDGLQQHKTTLSSIPFSQQDRRASDSSDSSSQLKPVWSFSCDLLTTEAVDVYLHCFKHCATATRSADYITGVPNKVDSDCVHTFPKGKFVKCAFKKKTPLPA